MLKTAELNEKWAAFLIDQLYQQKVKYFCIAPGSRSTPLVMQIAEHPKLSTFVHFDERGLGFHALGFAKAKKEPVAIVVTSGTAVCNLFPALVEASLDFVPLIVLTADRPPELRDCGANQTIDQVKIFSEYMRWQVDLPCPDQNISEKMLSSTISYAVYKSRFPLPGPVHLNCMFREPLFSYPSKPYSQSLLAPIYENSDITYPSTTFQSIADQLASFEKGAILLGSHMPKKSLSVLEMLSQKLKWPIFADVISNNRNFLQKQAYKNDDSGLIPYYDLILKSQRDLKLDALLYIGNRIVSKTVAEWISSHPNLPYFHIQTYPSRHDPIHRATHTLSCDPLYFCKEVLPYLPQRKSSWILKWKQYANCVDHALQSSFSAFNFLSEPEIFHTFNTILPSDWNLFIANSMPIRDADLFFFPKDFQGEVFANRGASGIDGNIATAIGIAAASKKPTVAVIGDQTFLHDLNSLAQSKDISTPLYIILINNGGGGIFSFFPIAQKSTVLERFFARSHSLTFENAAKLFDLPYFTIQSKLQWTDFWKENAKSPSSSLIEIRTNRCENVLHHKTLYEQVDIALCSPLPALV